MMEDRQYITEDGPRYRVRVPNGQGGRIHVGNFDTLEAAIEARDKARLNIEHVYIASSAEELEDRVHNKVFEFRYNHEQANEFKRKIEGVTSWEFQPQAPTEPTITGATLDDDDADVDALWRAAFEAQAAVQQQQAKKKSNHITLPNEPVAIAFLSDLHFGSAGTDYRAAKEDAETVRDTPGMYAVFHGDGLDQWIIGKLAMLQRYQAMSGDAEMRLFASWLEILRDKLLAVVSGNHDLWSHKLAGIDIVAQHLKGVRCLYDKHQVVVTLDHNATTRKMVVRHKWRFNSVYNPTHGLEVGWDRGDIDYDWAVGGHTHIATYFRDFYRHGKRRTAILTGAYKRVDGFADEIGFASCKDNGCGAKVLHPDGREWAFNNLQEAAAFLGYLRGE